MEKNFSKAQQEAKAYVEYHGLEKLIGDMLNALVYAQDPSPPIFMIKYLASFVPSDELAAKEIHIGAHPSPSSVYLENVVKEESIRASETGDVEKVRNTELKQVTEEEVIRVEIESSTKKSDVPVHVPDPQIEEKGKEEEKVVVIKDQTIEVEHSNESKAYPPVEVNQGLSEDPVVEEVKPIVDKFNPSTEDGVDVTAEVKVDLPGEVRTESAVEIGQDAGEEVKIDPSTDENVDRPIVNNEESKAEVFEEEEEEVKTKTEDQSEFVIPTEEKAPEPAEEVVTSEANPPVVSEDPPPA